ncbi:MAG TPA: hypothetical protein VK425_09370, partial [Acidimicrobiales bacterium]|nr:hypothetical protein [Acidimicrobiales bacterium]
MANTQWLDRSQPQTLYFANILLYFDAAWWLLYLLLGAASWFTLLAIPAVLAGVGIANEKKLGYWGAIVVAALNLLGLIYWFLLVHGQSISIIISLIFGVALLALLLHPMSRSYQRIWFKKMNALNRNR